MNQTALEVVKPEPITPMRLLEIATSQDADLDKLQKLMELQMTWEANEARKAYYAAMKLFKDAPPQIRKNGTGHNNTRYATLDHACDQIIPALAKVGITHKWKVKAADKKVVVACVLSHELGYSDPDPPTMEADADTSGNKNAIQALGSSLKYLERYTLFAAAGLDDGSKDDDGKTTEPSNKLADHLVVAALDDIEACETLVELQRIFGSRYKMGQEAGDQAFIAQLIKAKDARKEAIRASN